MNRNTFRALCTCLLALVGVCATALGQATLPRVALQYWQTGDYPNKAYGHNGPVWVEGHDEENGDGSGHWEDQDGDGSDDTWVPDTHWVEGHYEDQWIQDGVYADGEFGSTWSTSAGEFNINSSASVYSAAATGRGFLNIPVNIWEIVTFRAWGLAPSNNCNSYSFTVYNPSGSVAGNGATSGTFGSNSYGQGWFYASQNGQWRIEVRYQGATGVSPSSGAVNYYFTVGPVAQSISFDVIPRHSVGDAAFAPTAVATSGLPVSFSILSGPATITNGAITVTADGTVNVRAAQPGGVTGGTIWSAAPSVDRSFTVSGTAQTISFPAVANHTHGDAPFALTAAATSGLPVAFVVNSGPATLSGSTVTLTGGGNVTITASQAGNTSFGPAPSVSRTFAVAPDASVPTTPTSLVASAIGTGGFTLSWAASNDNIGVTAYEVQRNGTVVSTVTSPTVTFTGLAQTTLYAMAVRARDSTGNWSAWSAPLNVTTLAFLPPRLAVQYWQSGDYPGKPYGHNTTFWVDGHDEDNDDGSGHWEDQDGDGNDDTWIPDTHWVDGHYETSWVWDGTYPDGEFGSSWATSTGTFNIGESGSSAVNTSRGHLLAAYPNGWTTLRLHFSAPTANCTTYSAWIRNPSGGVVTSWGNGGSGTEAQWWASSPTNAIWFNQAGEWSITLFYQNATGVTPADGNVTYKFWVGQTQTISFDTIYNHACGDAPFALSATTDSGLPVSYALVSGPATLAGNILTLTGEGTVVVRAFQAGGVNNGTTWAGANQERSFSVNGQPQAITFPPLADCAYGDSPPVLAGTSTAGLPVAYGVVSGPATVSGSSLTLTGVGTVTVRATQTGAGLFGPAQPVIRSFVVSKGSQTISFPSISGHTYGDAPFALSAASSSGLPIIYSVESGPATVAGSTLTLTGLGPVTLAANQPGSAEYHAAPPVARSFTVGRTPGMTYVMVQQGSASAVGGLPGTVVQLVAAAPPDGFGFTGWTIASGTGTLASPASTTTALTLGASDVTVAAVNVPFYTISVVNGTASRASGPQGAAVTVTANADAGTQYFANWSVTAGSGGLASPLQRSTTFTIGASHATISANYISSHTLAVRGLAPYGSMTIGSQSSAGGVRGSSILVSVPYPSGGSAVVFDGWQVGGSSGMVADQNQNGGNFIMGNTDTVVLGWWVYPEYKGNEIFSTVSTSPSTVATGDSYSINVTATAPVGAPLTNVSVEESANYGESWTTPDGFPWQGSQNSISFSRFKTLSSPATMVYRVRGSRNDGGTTFASLHSYARVFVLTPGSLQVNNGSASAYNGAPNTVVNLTAQIPPGQVFSTWRLVSGVGAIGSPSSPNTTFTFMEGGAVVQAEFRANYNLTVVNGSASDSGGVLGTVITITAETRAEAFVGWTFDGSGSGIGIIANPQSAVTTFTMGNYPATVRANYAGSLQKLILSDGSAIQPDGTPIPGGTTGPTGSTITIRANALNNYYFDSWRFIGAAHGNLGSSTQRTTTFTFGLGDTSLEPSYAVGGTLTLVPATGLPGGLSADDRVDYDGGAPGRAIPIHAAAPPPAGYRFSTWERLSAAVTGAITAASEPNTTFVMGTGNATIRALYVPSDPPPVITGGVASGTVGVPFSYQISATYMGTPGSFYAIDPTPSGLELAPTAGLISGTPTSAGPSSITLFATNSGGSATPKQLELTVARGTQTIAFGPLSAKTTNDAPFPLDASSSIGLPISFSVVDGPATVSGNIVTITGVGTVTIRASQIGNANYLPVDVERSFSVTLGATGVAPAIAVQPADRTILLGQGATFSVIASGTAPMTFQWRKNGVPLANGAVFSSVTGAMLNVSGATTETAGNLDVVITNGSGTVTSAVAVLTVVNSTDIADDDGDGVPNKIEQLLGTNSQSQGVTDASNGSVKLKIENPKP